MVLFIVLEGCGINILYFTGDMNGDINTLSLNWGKP
jgi:hypothetical protein